MASDEQRAYREKLKGLQFQPKGPRPNATKTTVLRAEDEGGRIAGTQTEHKDGRVDATVTPPIPKMIPRVETP